MKLSKLPDRTPVKLSTMLTPTLAARLRDYAEFYAETYGTREEVADLVPFMLEAFLDGDADFRRANRAGGAKDPSGGEARHLSNQSASKKPSGGSENLT
ncbi:DUF2274 domain-containing protein [Bradyrhizobium sp. KBS0727]|uniref:DUF2274 domain-containing protein n=1 Tax=unclassified Bradyrhizobium TaxID=2631580 RepID=UPI00110E13CA|nr:MULTISPECIES: DUF2274 domain-containing protein [unclassified Bradyrhizobium]QDW42149.1 DUF2274 domain-containing protein [Bradyrhizobium sp. KBS0725]QDW47090.1 DUF2274 domain-containing protein [Bradyrhizobium sp. KBS0727]